MIIFNPENAATSKIFILKKHPELIKIN